MVASVSLEPFEPRHLEALARRLASAPVARRYPEPVSNISWASDPPEGGSHAMIAWNSQEIGYVRWQRVTRETLDSLGLPEIPANSVDIDILIGEEAHLGKGIGGTALLQLVDKLRAQGAPMVGLSPEPDNAVAVRCYEKVGFRHTRNYSVGDPPREYKLMVLDLR